MKKGNLFFATLLTTGMVASSVKADTAISVDFFYEQLDPHGSWFEMDEYGYVWQPHNTSSDWSPYSDGRWVYTDAGWTWYSNEPYGWAVYHYGRWSNVRGVGWIWVPGTVWGPAWVSWRRSPRYVGWAPLPPEARFTAVIGFSSWVDRYYDIGPSNYRFVEMSNLGSPKLNSVFVDPGKNITIINETTNITNITYRDNIIHSRGPAYDEHLRTSREPIPRYKLDRRREVASDGRDAADGELQAQVEGDTLRVTDLPMERSSGGRPRKVAKTLDDAEVDRGWLDAGTPREIAAAREKIRASAELPPQLPDKPTKGRSISGLEDETVRSNPIDRSSSPEDKAPEKGRMKDERREFPEANPVLPPTPRLPEPGKGMRPGEGNLPPDPNAPLPGNEKGTADLPVEHPEQRPESRGTMKDPAHPGTETGFVPPAPGAPASPRPPAPGGGISGQPVDRPAPPPQTREGGEGDSEGPVQDGQTQDGVRMPPPPPPGGSATPPLPPVEEERQSVPPVSERDESGDRGQPSERLQIQQTKRRCIEIMQFASTQASTKTLQHT